MKIDPNTPAMIAARLVRVEATPDGQHRPWIGSTPVAHACDVVCATDTADELRAEIAAALEAYGEAREAVAYERCVAASEDVATAATAEYDALLVAKNGEAREDLRLLAGRMQGAVAALDAMRALAAKAGRGGGR